MENYVNISNIDNPMTDKTTIFYKLTLFIMGFCSVFYTNTKLSLYIRLFFLIIILFYLFYDIFIISKKVAINGFYWYIIFFLFVFLSLIYTSDDSSYMVVIERMIPGVFIGMAVFQSKNRGLNISSFFAGVVIGMSVSAFIVILSNIGSLGQGRIGSDFYGSDVEFGALCCYAIFSSFILIFIYKKQIFLWIILSMFLYFGVLISGTRKSTIQPILVLCLIIFFKNLRSPKILLVILFSAIAIIGA
jgi:hypothetical protein